MTVYPYVPPAREYADTILAFKDFQDASTWSVRVDPDPLGPVNKIVTLIRGTYRVKSVLAPVPTGAKVRLVRDEGSPLVRLWSAGWEELGQVGEARPSGWRIEVDDRTVLSVTDAETWPPAPPKPYIPWHLRIYRALKSALAQQARADLDKLAGRLGYHRHDECGGDW